LQEDPEGKVANLWKEKLVEANVSTVDVAAGLAQVFAVKDANGVADAKRSAFLVASVMRSYVTPTIESDIFNYPPPPPRTHCLDFLQNAVHTPLSGVPLSGESPLNGARSATQMLFPIHRDVEAENRC